ncbi:MAG: hypothetical protein PVS2B1_00520 [Candidatus Dormibacteraceae bacterium]
MRVGRDVCNAVALLDAQALERGGPPVTALEELRVREAEVAVHDSFTLPIQLSSAARELERCQRSLHSGPPFMD